MKLLFLTEKLHASEVFQEYKKTHPDAYFFAGFFTLDLETKNNQYELDYSDEKGSIMTFSLSPEIKPKPAEPINNAIPKPIKAALKIDIDDIEEIAIKEGEKKKMKISKIMAILQNHEGRVIWSLTCMQAMNILKIKLDSATGEIMQSESVNMLDFVKRIKKGQ